MTSSSVDGLFVSGTCASFFDPDNFSDAFGNVFVGTDATDEDRATLGDLFSDGYLNFWEFSLVQRFGSTLVVDGLLNPFERDETAAAGIEIYGTFSCDGNVANITGQWTRARDFFDRSGRVFSYIHDIAADGSCIVSDVTGGGPFHMTTNLSTGDVAVDLYGTVGFQDKGSAQGCERD